VNGVFSAETIEPPMTGLSGGLRPMETQAGTHLHPQAAQQSRPARLQRETRDTTIVRRLFRTAVRQGRRKHGDWGVPLRYVAGRRATGNAAGSLYRQHAREGLCL